MSQCLAYNKKKAIRHVKKQEISKEKIQSIEIGRKLIWMIEDNDI